MAIRTQTREISVHSDPLSFSASIKVLAGNPVQGYNKEEGKYIPDRFADKDLNLTLLVPVVSVSDPEKIQSGPQIIVGCEWYEGAPGKGKRITESEYYHINHPNIEGYNPDNPSWALEVMKNFEPNKPCEIYAVFTFIDHRRNEEVKVERSIIFRTTYFDLDSVTLHLKDTPAHQRVDPMLVTPNEKGQWLCVLSAQLYAGKKVVPDDKAAYWWQIFDKGEWRNFNQDERAVYVSGDTTKTLLVDARFVRLSRFRCLAARHEGTRPSTPPSEEFVKTTSIKVEFSKLLKVDLRQTAGVKISPRMDTPCAFEVDIFDQNGTLPKSKENLFSTVWKVISDRPGSVATTLGGGREFKFVPSDVNLDLVYPSSVSAEVEMHAVGALVSIGGKVLKIGNEIVTTSKFE